MGSDTVTPRVTITPISKLTHLTWITPYSSLLHNDSTPTLPIPSVSPPIPLPKPPTTSTNTSLTSTPTTTLSTPSSNSTFCPVKNETNFLDDTANFINEKIGTRKQCTSAQGCDETLQCCNGDKNTCQLKDIVIFLCLGLLLLVILCFLCCCYHCCCTSKKSDKYEMEYEMTKQRRH